MSLRQPTCALDRLSSLTVGDSEPSAGRRRDSLCDVPGEGAGAGLLQRCVVVQKDRLGFGFTMCGERLKLVQNVRAGGAAVKAGVREGDRIVKVNGSLVSSMSHQEVVKLIKAGTYVALTLQGPPPSPSPPPADPAPARRPLPPGENAPSPSGPSGSPSRRITAPKPLRDSEVQRQASQILRKMLHQEEMELQALMEERRRRPSPSLEERIRSAERRAQQVRLKLPPSPRPGGANKDKEAQDRKRNPILKYLGKPGGGLQSAPPGSVRNIVERFESHPEDGGDPPTASAEDGGDRSAESPPPDTDALEEEEEEARQTPHRQETPPPRDRERAGVAQAALRDVETLRRLLLAVTREDALRDSPDERPPEGNVFGSGESATDPTDEVTDGGRGRHPSEEAPWHAVNDVEGVFRTVENLTSKLRRLKDMEGEHRKLLTWLREPSAPREEEDRGWADGKEASPAQPRNQTTGL
ncbi:rho guanine nucleotide exchange factor 11-like isoform X2 [Hippocampus zosterae]|uniref:rho guanine nucleotide exchange factor 11-like isoform X2 n=1 Tax=Hippocampus zosterae TaxID=109293 RepID=UPI00223E1A43|nr:rho guanine nucleotide exchange factor 11-like isoform X2 [Hippocampus zosterae]